MHKEVEKQIDVSLALSKIQEKNLKMTLSDLIRVFSKNKKGLSHTIVGDDFRFLSDFQSLYGKSVVLGPLCCAMSARGFPSLVISDWTSPRTRFGVSTARFPGPRFLGRRC